MYDFLDIVLAIVVYLSPPNTKAVQMWPNAGDTKQTPAGRMNELSVTYQKNGNQWCEDFGDTNKGPCIIVADGKLLDEQGKVLLNIKDNLKVISRTNYVLYPKDWNNPLKFSWQENKDKQIISIYDGTNVTREIRIKFF